VSRIVNDTGVHYADRDHKKELKLASLSAEAAEIATRFVNARRRADGFDEFPGVLPASLQEAYSIQDQAIGEWGLDVIGWKIGRVPEPFATRFGTDRLAGPIFVQTVAGDEPTAMPVFANGFAAGEAEFLIRIGKAPPRGQTHFSLQEVSGLVDRVHVGIEVASSPLKTINELGPAAVVSDFGNNNGIVVGPEIPNWRQSGFEDWSVTTLIDGKVVGQGSASSFPDGALGSVRFLFELMAKRQIPLRAGQWVSTGAITGVHDAQAGQHMVAIFDDRFNVSCKLVPQSALGTFPTQAAADAEFERDRKPGG
jgi:2-keto-4-pentenoate hydratase